MLKKRSYRIFTFATTTAAMAWEEGCLEKGLPGRLIPLPGAVAAGCGLCWRVPLAEAGAFADAFLQCGQVEASVDVEM